MSDSATSSDASADNSSKHSHILNIRLWPRIPVLYPMALVALICGFITMGSGADSSTGHVCGLIFLAVTAFSLFTLTIDIGFTWALLWLAGVVIVGLILFIINIYHPFIKEVLPWLAEFKPFANHQFYFTVFMTWALILLVAAIVVRFHYVKIESNEVIVVGGVLDKRRRFSTMGMRYTKEITDVFEYYLPFVRSGRLVLSFPNESEPLVLEVVIGIDRVIKRLEHITGVMQVAPESNGQQAN
jgi:hypothetical protein